MVKKKWLSIISPTRDTGKEKTRSRSSEKREQMRKKVIESEQTSSLQKKYSVEKTSRLESINNHARSPVLGTVIYSTEEICFSIVMRTELWLVFPTPLLFSCPSFNRVIRKYGRLSIY